MDNVYSSKKIATNTVVLFLRTFITMLIALYTSRVVLKSLGVNDYGLYQVVGGVVSLMTILTAGLSLSTQRYLSYELGCSTPEKIRQVFTTCFYTHAILVGVLLIIGETIGIWFLNNYIQIPLGREFAANVILQFSLISLCLNLLISPYSACVIAHEQMKLYAYIGIFDAVLKLGIALVISFFSKDRLILYGFLMMLVTVVNLLYYVIICHRRFVETHLMWYWNKSQFKEISQYISWTLLGQGAMVGANQGNNILVNRFFSVTANAAMGIANQVNVAISSLTQSFGSAYTPQITKLYSSGDLLHLNRVVMGASKLSFALLFLVSFPILLNIDLLLNLWLDVVPDNVSIFCVIFVISTMVNSLGNPFRAVILASGKIKKFQIYTALIYASDLVVLYVFFRLGFPVYFAPLVKLLIDCFLTLLRILMAKKYLSSFSLRLYFGSTVGRLALSCVVTITIAYVFLYCLGTDAFLRLIITCVCVPLSFLSMYIFALTKEEKRWIWNYLNTLKTKIK